MVDPVRGLLLHLGLRVEGDPQASFTNHQEVICTVPHRNDLVQVNSLRLSDGSQELCLPLGVDDGPYHLARQSSAIRRDFELENKKKVGE